MPGEINVSFDLCHDALNQTITALSSSNLSPSMQHSSKDPYFATAIHKKKGLSCLTSQEIMYDKYSIVFFSMKQI